jgi:adenylate cyclase
MKSKKLFPFILVGLMVGLVLSGLFVVGVFSNVQRTLTDAIYGERAPLQNIVIVAIDDKSLQEIGRWPWDRDVFARVFEPLNQSTLVGVDVGFFESTSDDGVLADAIEAHGNVVLAAEYMSFSSEEGRIIGGDILEPVSELHEAAQAIGYINIITDRDGVTRAMNTAVGGPVQSFAAVIAQSITKDPVQVADRYLINYVGGPQSYETHSFADVVSGRVDASVFADQVVLIGATSPDLHDTFFVPTSKGSPMPGVEVLANGVQTLILNNPLRTQSPVSVVLLICALALLASGGFYVFHLRMITVLSAVAAVGYLFVTIYLFNKLLVLNVVFPPLAIVGAYTGSLAYAYVLRKKQREEIEHAFGKYVSKAVINEILEHPEKLTLGGERREITVFFSDIRGFTAVSERLNAEELVQLLNEYLTHMTDIIIEERGIVDKYMGDAIMAFWGAPLDEPDHAVRACRTTLRMNKRLRALQEDWDRRGIPSLHIGAGLNTGDCVVGNMGSTQRFDYTAMGDTVNLGSRLEGVNKMYGTETLISEATYERVKNEFVTRRIDKIKVKGRSAPIMIYELIGEKGSVSPLRLAHLKEYEEALEYYWNQEWDKAIKSFRAVLKTRKSDMPPKLFVERCQAYKKNPPQKNWDGVFIMKTK